MKSIRLISLKLTDFKPLGVPAIQSITIYFKHRFHWLVGKNGSGKSTIVREASPLAPDMRQFRDGGSKVTVWEVEDKTYELVSKRIDAKKSMHHFFLVNPDGSKEELNQGNTVTVFTALVLSIFNIDKESRSICIGSVNFTTMDTATRKAIFTSMSSTDYTYALGYYKRLYRTYRDIQGSLRVDNERLVELRSTGLKDELEKTIVEEIQDLRKQVEKLMDIRPNVSESEEEIRAAIESVQKEISTLFTFTMDTSKRGKEHYPLEPLDKIQSELFQHKARFEEKERRLDELFRSFTKASHDYAKMASVDSEARKKMEETIFKNEAKISEIEYAIANPNLNVDGIAIIVERAASEFEGVRPYMTSLNGLNPDDYSNLRLMNGNLLNEVITLKNAIKNTSDEIQSLEDHQHDPDITCPKCDHRFNPKFSSEKITFLKSKLENLIEVKNKKSDILDKVKKDIETIEAFNQGQLAWGRYTNKYPELVDIWGHVTTEQLNLLNPDGIRHCFTFFNTDIGKRHIEIELRKEIDECTKLLKVESDSDNRRTEEQQNKVKSLEKELEERYEQRSKDIDTLATLEGKFKLASVLSSSAEKAKALKQTLEGLVTKSYHHFERRHISDFIRTLDVEISSREGKLRMVSRRNMEIIHLEQQIETSKERIKALKDILAVLSPSEGLIAKGMTGFINHFTGLMNDVISRFVTNKIVIRPLKPSEDSFELNYEFPMDVHCDDGTILEAPDVREASKGQSEIINLAFRILYMKFRGLEATLLPLDEFGANLDAAHRNKAFEAIMKILEVSNFTQVIMVSHIDETFNLMDGKGVTVICPANVKIPESLSYNDTTVIKRTTD